MLTARKTLTPTERMTLELLLAGSDPVLELLRKQADTVDAVHRIRLDGKSLASGPHLSISLQPNTRKRSLSVSSKARRLPGFADLIVEVGRATMLPSLRLHNGFLSHLTLRHHQGTVPNALRRPLKEYGYKSCAEWDEPTCEHIPTLGLHLRPPLDISGRYPPRPDDAPRAPKWLRSMEDRVDVAEPVREEDLAAVQAVADAPIPDDLVDFLRWTDGLETYDITVFSAREMFMVDNPRAEDRLLAVGTDASGDLYALDLTRPTDGDYPVLHLTHDPVGRRRAAARVRTWLTAALREGLD